MSKLNCPHCEKPGISALRKMWLGPAVPATCKACSKKVGVPYTSMFAVVPFVASILASEAVESIMLKVAFWISGFIVMSIIYWRWVPLEQRD